MKRRPPRTLRYCEKCEANRIFIYNKIIQHSECSKCGHRFAQPFKESEETRISIINHVDNRICELRQQRQKGIGLRILDARIDELKKIRDIIKPRKE
jgi:hypothetical protein